MAIKLIRAGMDSRQVLARFDAERQALALMDHPHIARVLDGGVTERGRPFFVMEYIKGLPLTEYCDKAQLSLRERLQLFIPVCQAVQHAHLKGIVHRDLKPSNILVCLYDGRAVPKVIDFGLARALHYDLTELSLHTSHGQMVGTPVYMSPEQAEFNNLDIDTRSDVYSLGVVLYELLTGLTPLDKHRLQKAAWDEMLRLIREEEPLPPSTRISGSERLPGLAAQRRMDPRLLQQSLSGELDWIVMRALEKERSRRYETSSGLARDIERYLADEAVEACPPSRLYRWRKFVRRHRPQVLAVGTLLLGLNAAIAGLAWGWQQSREAEARVSQTLRELLRERAAKEQAVAEGQRERDLSRSKRAEAILASISSVSADSANAETLPPGALKALRQSFRAWSEIPNDAERVEVLEIGLTKPPESLILARHQTSVLQACVGISPNRRQAALKMLLDKQRCTDCAPEVRATACLLTLALGATETPALTEAAQVFQSHTPLMEDLQRQLWRRLPAFPDTAREAPLQLLLNTRVRYENPSDRQLDVPDEVRRLVMMGRIPCALDWYACLEPPATESWPIGLAGWYWNRLIRDLKTCAAVVPPDAKHPEAGIRGSHFLYRLVPALPDELLPVAASDMLDYLHSSISDNSDAPIYWTDFRDWMTALVQRLRPEHLAAIVQRLQTRLSGHSDPHALRVFSPLLQDLLPRISVQHRAALARLLFTCVRPSSDWDESSQQTLSWTLGLAVRDLDAQEVAAFLQPFAAMPDGEAKTRATEVLVYVIRILAPHITPEVAGAWTKQLWQSLNAVAVRARLSGTRPYTGIPAALEALAHRLEAAEWATSAERFAALTQASEKPYSEDPIFLDTARRIAPWLPPDVQARFRTELLASIATPAPAAAALPAADPLQAENPAAAHVESELVDSRIALLGAVVMSADPAGDAELIQQLQQLVEKSATPGRTTAQIAAAMQALAGRGEPARPRQLWNVVLGALQRETWGIPYDTSKEGGRMFDIPRAEIDVWQKNSSLLERHVAPLLGVLAERLAAEDVGPAWDDLLRLLNITTSDGFFTEWDHTRAELCKSALTTLAARTPPAECVRRLQELIAAARYDRNTGALILSPFSSQGCSMFHAALKA
ncbi:MAG: protein kinase domain-containing protein, partial [Planctomycetaceae bacterium]